MTYAAQINNTCQGCHRPEGGVVNQSLVGQGETHLIEGDYFPYPVDQTAREEDQLLGVRRPGGALAGRGPARP